MRFLFVDRILHNIPGKHIEGIKHVTPDDAFLSKDDKGHLIFTSSLIGETLGQLAAWSVMQKLDFALRPVAGVVSKVALRRPVYLGETLFLSAEIDALDETAVQYHGSAFVNDEVVFELDGAIGPMLPMENFICREVVQNQFKQINRPLDGALQFQGKRLEQPLASNGQPTTVSMHFDTILQHEPGVSMKAMKVVSMAAPYFLDHFPRKPVLPMTILLECQQNLAREFIRQAGWDFDFSQCEMRRIKMNDFVYPGDCVICSLSVKHHDENGLTLAFRSEVDGKRVCVMELILK